MIEYPTTIHSYNNENRLGLWTVVWILVPLYLTPTGGFEWKLFLFWKHSAAHIHNFMRLTSFCLTTRKIYQHRRRKYSNFSVAGTTSLVINIRLWTTAKVTFNFVDRLVTHVTLDFNFCKANVDVIRPRQQFSKLIYRTAVRHPQKPVKAIKEIEPHPKNSRIYCFTDRAWRESMLQPYGYFSTPIPQLGTCMNTTSPFNPIPTLLNTSQIATVSCVIWNCLIWDNARNNHGDYQLRTKFNYIISISQIAAATPHKAATSKIYLRYISFTLG